MSRNIFNTSYKVQSDINTEEERLYYNIEEGAHVTTSAGVWTVWNGEWVKLYPSAGSGSGLGWARYDDNQYTSLNKLSLVDGVEVTLPNNASNVVTSHAGVEYYDADTNKVLAEYENDLYLMTAVFKASAANANATFLTLNLEAGNGTPYDRIKFDIPFPKGNDAEHDEHHMFQYYADSSFITNGSQLKITSVGGSAEVWDIIFFISKVQSYA
jgi:hypothetical protein